MLKKIEKTTILSAILVALSLPILLKFRAYPFRALIPCATLVFIYLELPYLKNVPSYRSPLILFLAIASTIIYFYILFSYSLALAFWCIPITFFLWVVAIQGWPRARSMVLSSLFLCFIIPSEQWLWILPFLKSISIEGTRAFLYLCGIASQEQYNTIYFAGMDVFINDRCAGFGFLSKIVLFALLVSILGRFSHYQCAFLLLIAPIMAILANIMRISLYCLTTLYYPTPKLMAKLDVIYGSIIFFGMAISIGLIARYFNKKRLEKTNV